MSIRVGDDKDKKDKDKDKDKDDDKKNVVVKYNLVGYYSPNPVYYSYFYDLPYYWGYYYGGYYGVYYDYSIGYDWGYYDVAFAYDYPIVYSWRYDQAWYRKDGKTLAKKDDKGGKRPDFDKEKAREQIANIKKEIFGDAKFNTDDIRKNNKAYDVRWLTAQLKVAKLLTMEDMVNKAEAPKKE